MGLFQQKAERKLCGFDKKPCVQEKCMHWRHVTGTDPQDAKPFDLEDCAFNWQMVLQLDANKEIRYNTASVDKAHNFDVEAANAGHNFAAHQANVLAAALTRMAEELSRISVLVNSVPALEGEEPRARLR